MDQRGNSKDQPKMLSNGKTPFAIFDHSGSSVRVVHSTPDMALFGDIGHVKRMAFEALEKSRAARGSSPGSEILIFPAYSSEISDISDENSGMKSDADSCEVDELTNQEGASKKLEILRKMVGVESGEPEEVVLAEVVRVLRDLEDKNRRNARMKINNDA